MGQKAKKKNLSTFFKAKNISNVENIQLCFLMPLDQNDLFALWAWAVRVNGFRVYPDFIHWLIDKQKQRKI